MLANLGLSIDSGTTILLPPSSDGCLEGILAAWCGVLLRDIANLPPSPKVVVIASDLVLGLALCHPSEDIIVQRNGTSNACTITLIAGLRSV